MAPQRRPDGGRGDHLDRFVSLYVDRPHACMGGCFFVLVALTAASVLGGAMNFTLDQDSAWNVNTGKFTEASTAHKQALQAAGVGSSGSSASRRQVKTEPLTLYYKTGNGEDMVFAPKHLRDLCLLESAVYRSTFCQQAAPGTRCPGHSPVAVFYGDAMAAANAGCPELTQAAVDATVQAMATSVALEGTGSRYRSILHPSFAVTNKTSVTQSQFRISGDNHTDFEKTFLFDVFFKQFDPPLEYSFLRSAFQVDEDQFAKFGSVRARVYYPVDEFMKMVPTDFYMAVLSVVFVFLTIWGYLNSCFLAVFSMWQIISSLPIAALLYRKVFMVDYYEFVHILVVYLVLGIGADDIFVLLDTWRHITDELEIKPGSRDRGKLMAALRATWVRTASAVFNTSFTTGVAFISMSISKVMPMKTMGYYACICIIFNYILAITFTPALLMVYHLRFSGKRCCCPRPALREDGAAKVEAEMPEDDAAKVEAKIPEGEAVPKEPAVVRGGGCFARVIESGLQRFYLPFMKYKVGPIRPGALFAVLVMLGVAVQGLCFAMQLTPPRTEEQWFPQNHMWINFPDYSVKNSYSPDHDRYGVIKLTWGIAGLDFSTFSEYRPDDQPGTVVFDDAFDLSTAAAQNAVLDTCTRFRQLGCALEGCRGQEDGSLVLKQGSKVGFMCFLEEFGVWLNQTHGITQQLTGQNFIQKLLEFRQADPSASSLQGPQAAGGLLELPYREEVGAVGGQLKFVSVSLRSTLAKLEPYGTGIEVRRLVDEFVEERKAAMPDSLKSIHVVSNVFKNYDLGEELIGGFFSGCMIAGPVVFIVLLLSTRNIILALYAVTAVGSIVVCVLGFCKSAMDYDLGVGEAIAGIIVIGYSVDYVVHLAHIYCEAGAHGIEKREDRASFAILNMGSTVFAGAITTAGSGMFMFFCFLTFFFKMALLICVTILFSFLFALFFFMGLVFMIGPEGNMGVICCCDRFLHKRKQEEDTKEAPPADVEVAREDSLPEGISRV